MFVQSHKLTCVLILILPSLAIGQSELLPLPGYTGSTRQVTQLFEAPTGEPTPAGTPNLQPTPTSTPTPGFSDQVLQLPGTDLMKNGASSGQEAFQSVGDNIPFESPLVGSGVQPQVVTNSRCGPGGCRNGDCSNRNNNAGPQIYTGLDPNSSLNKNANPNFNAPLAGAASVFSNGIVQGDSNNQMLAISGPTNNVFVPPVPTGSPLPGGCACGGIGCSACGGGPTSPVIAAPAASIAGYGNAPMIGAGGCGDSCSVDEFVEEPCGDGCGLFGNLLQGGGWGSGILSRLGGCGAGPCGAQRFYGSAQYLYWWTRGQQVPALVTSSPIGTDVSRAGVLGHPSTQTLLGGRRLDSNGFSGGLFTLGMNLDPTGNNAIEIPYLFLGDEESLYDRTASGNEILARPFYNVFTGEQDAEFVSFPNLVEGRMRVSTNTNFRGYGIRWRHNLFCGNNCFTRTGGPCGSCFDDTCGVGLGTGCGVGRGFSAFLNNLCNGGGFRSFSGFASGLQLRAFDLLLGWRHIDLDESLRFEENLTSIDTTNGVPVGTTLDIVDEFRTTNNFDGVDLGLAWEWGSSRWGINLQSGILVGGNRQRAFIDGSTTITSPNANPIVHSGGLLALDSNIGVYEREKFTVIPQVGFNVYYSLFPGARLTFGYNVIYFDDVIRPGSLIDTGVDPRLLPPAVGGAQNRPAYIAQTDNFWAQGLNFGLEFCF